jgi:hypothetical protein
VVRQRVFIFHLDEPAMSWVISEEQFKHIYTNLCLVIFLEGEIE